MIDQQKLKDLIMTLKLDSNEQVADVNILIWTHWNDLQRTDSIDTQSETVESSKNDWFHQSVCDLGIDYDVIEWIRDKSATMEVANSIIQLEDPNHINFAVLGEDEEDSSDSDSDIFGSLRHYRDQPSKQIGNSHCDGVIIYRLFNLAQLQYDELTLIQNQQKSTHYLQQDISRKQYMESRISCEKRLTTIYARDTLFNMLKIWAENFTTLFPLEKFGNSTFIVKLFRLMFYHYIYTNENIDWMSLLITSLLKVEMKQLREHITIHNGVNREILQKKGSLLYALQKDIFSQMIQFLLEPSLLNENCADDSIVNEETMVKQPNLKFVWKILNLFLELITDKSMMKQNQIDMLASMVFPAPLINLMFNLFLLVETHQSKIFLLRLFSR